MFCVLFWLLTYSVRYGRVAGWPPHIQLLHGRFFMEASSRLRSNAIDIRYSSCAQLGAGDVYRGVGLLSAHDSLGHVEIVPIFF